METKDRLAIQLANPAKNAQTATAILGEVAETVTINPENAATAEMSVEELGTVARIALGRGAEWAWSLGRAMQFAKIKFERNNAGYKKWKAEYLPELKIRTAQRYEALGVLDFETVKGKTISEVYNILWPEQAKKKPKAKKPNKVKRMTAGAAVDYLLAEIDKNGSTLLELHRDKLESLFQKLGTILQPSP